MGYCESGSTHQSLHGTVESVAVVAAELGVDTLERGVTLGLRLLDTVAGRDISGLFFCSCVVWCSSRKEAYSMQALVWGHPQESPNIQTPTS